MEHLADELDARRLVWVLFFKVHNESESAVFERSIGRANNNRIPNDRGDNE